ncbi:hypothetical protein BRC63_07920 [Halobacteriales archaeon QH_10_70_21]|nr:MAG: hypothetical protein BRC63_07920 [Halobacteriales archaeon QH_10_70_21]
MALSVALTVSLALGVAAQELPPEQPPQEGIIPAGGDLSTEDIIVPSSQDEVSELTVEYTAPDARRFVFVVITDEPVGEPPVDLSTVRGAEEVVPGSSGAVDVSLNFQEGGGPYTEDGEAYIYLSPDPCCLYGDESGDIIVEQIDIRFEDDDEPTLSDVAVNAESDSGDDGGTDASAEAGEITMTVESEETPVNMEVVVEGPNDTTTLTREDVSGDSFEGYESTVEPEEPGEYTVTIEQARTAGNDDLLEETGEITRTVTIEGDNETDATNGTAAGNGTDADPDVSRERPACTSADPPDEVTVDGEDVSTVPPVESADAERLETTTAEVDGEQRRVQLIDTTGDGTADLAVVDRDGDGDLDPTCGQFRTVNPNLEWESWEDAVA